MDKKRYIDQETIKLLQRWGTLAFSAGAVVILSLSILDYFVTPDNFSKFLSYRSITALSFAILLIFYKQKKASRRFLINTLCHCCCNCCNHGRAHDTFIWRSSI